ncbi:MAG: esterase [Epsilonproteobacteria bacterium 4484_65]|nr:MAG: esterase [Epsilonproteobacteria bacterium 4484_65]HEC45340.1 esterase [Campylobacterota bacterium]
MIIYIHGFGSHGLGSKAIAFRNYFKGKGEAFIAPSLSYIPDLAIQTLEELIESYDDVQLIGSSLGGYYTLYLAQEYGLKAVLINPSIYPYITLKKVLGEAPSFYDESHFAWMESHLEMLKKYETDLVPQKDVMLLLQKGDETLDYREAEAKLPHAKQIVEEGGSHSFDGIERYFDEVDEFLN